MASGLASKMDRFRQRSFDWPSIDRDPLSDQAFRKPEISCPLGHRTHLATIHEANVRPLVRRLAFHRNPPNVTGFIVPVGVNAIKRVSIAGSRTDIAQKRSETCSPFLADENPSRAVTVVSRASRIRAALDHRGPRQIFLRPTTPACRSMLYGCETEARSAVTSARHLTSRKNVRARDEALAPARTSRREGASVSFARIRRANDEKLTERLPGDVDWPHIWSDHTRWRQ